MTDDLAARLREHADRERAVTRWGAMLREAADALDAAEAERDEALLAARSANASEPVGHSGEWCACCALTSASVEGECANCYQTVSDAVAETMRQRDAAEAREQETRKMHAQRTAYGYNGERKTYDVEPARPPHSYRPVDDDE